ncbi:MAG: ribonuclease D [Panacagrimonas sp.]
MPSSVIADPAVLADHLAQWREAPFLALDTEFIREQTYYPQLCLIQVGDGRSSQCIDPLAGLDLADLLELLHTPSMVSVFHAAGQDLEIFVQLTGRCPQPLFDTQVAAAMLGYGEQLGYAGLVDKMLGIKLDKSLSRTNWARRPLNDKEIAYAADDVRHLATLYPRLHQELEARGRLAWLQEDCAQMCDPTRYRMSPETEWKRLKGLSRLGPRAQHLAARLAAWREVIAENKDRPRRWILSDEALYAIAERQPTNLAQLGELQVLPPKSLERQGDALMDLLSAPIPQDVPALVSDARPSEAEKARIKRVLERARALADALQIPASLLAPRADIEALALQGAAADVALLRGWRRECAGEELLKLVS